MDEPLAGLSLHLLGGNAGTIRWMTSGVSLQIARIMPSASKQLALSVRIRPRLQVQIDQFLPILVALQLSLWFTILFASRRLGSASP